MNALLLFLGGRFGVWALYAAAGIGVLMATDIGRLRLWTVPHLESKLAAAQKGWDTEKTGRLADRTVAAEAARKQSETFRATEQAWQAKQQETENEAQTKIAAAKADAAAAIAASGRLRDRLAAARAAASRAPDGSLAPAQCAPAIATVDMQSELLRRMDEHGRQLAAYADATRIAGEACISAWPKVTP